MNEEEFLPSVEPLTKREMQVLRRLSKGLSNREISEELVVTLGTIKWYNKQIFNKLGVHNRTHAVARARYGGILPLASPRICLRSS